MVTLVCMFKEHTDCSCITLFVRLEINCLNHDKVVPIDLSIRHTLFFSFLLLLLSLSLLELRPLNTVSHLMVVQ